MDRLSPVLGVISAVAVSSFSQHGEPRKIGVVVACNLLK
jgi:hypothetical protein